MPDLAGLADLGREVHRWLASRNCRLVLAESCTSGLVAATLGMSPGVSAHFCGSSVTYRERTKHDWLEISWGLLEAHSAVSREVTQAMARAALRHTPEAELGLAVTGHLGPSAPPDHDGIVFVCLATATSAANAPAIDQATMIAEGCLRLQAAERLPRQVETVESVLRWLMEVG